jgi:hypothetical protein
VWLHLQGFPGAPTIARARWARRSSQENSRQTSALRQARFDAWYRSGTRRAERPRRAPALPVRYAAAALAATVVGATKVAIELRLPGCAEPASFCAAGVCLRCPRDGRLLRTSVGRRVSSSLRSDRALDALDQALHAGSELGCLIDHSDRAVQYPSVRHADRLLEAGTEPSGAKHRRSVRQRAGRDDPRTLQDEAHPGGSEGHCQIGAGDRSRTCTPCGSGS